MSRFSQEPAKEQTATAYKAVMKPKEGTILTVAKGISQKAAELAEINRGSRGVSAGGYPLCRGSAGTDSWSFFRF